jgi:hypothetical protein
MISKASHLLRRLLPTAVPAWRQFSRSIPKNPNQNPEIKSSGMQLITDALKPEKFPVLVVFVGILIEFISIDLQGRATAGDLKSLKTDTKASFDKIEATTKASFDKIEATTKASFDKIEAKLDIVAKANQKSLENAAKANQKSLENAAKENRDSLEKSAQENRKMILELDEKMAAQLASAAKDTQASLEKSAEKNQASSEKAAEKNQLSLEKSAEESRKMEQLMVTRLEIAAKENREMAASFIKESRDLFLQAIMLSSNSGSQHRPNGGDNPPTSTPLPPSTPLHTPI